VQVVHKYRREMWLREGVHSESGDEEYATSSGAGLTNGATGGRVSGGDHADSSRCAASRHVTTSRTVVGYNTASSGMVNKQDRRKAGHSKDGGLDLAASSGMPCGPGTGVQCFVVASADIQTFDAMLACVSTRDGAVKLVGPHMGIGAAICVL
jgi:hypothetical protein